MKPGDLVGERFKVHAPLDPGGPASSLIVSERRRGRRPLWVLKWLPHGLESCLREQLRRDILDLASLKQETLALPAHFDRDPRTGRPFLLRPYIVGSDLLAAAQAWRPQELLPWMISSTEALGILHAAGFLHRAVKAANLIVPRSSLFARPSLGGRVVLCDPDWRPEETGEPAGESLAQGLRAEASVASDLYALGTVFYRLLTRREPDIGDSGFPSPPRRWNPEIPIDLERAVMKLLHPDPLRRYPDTRTLLNDLKSLCGSRAARLPSPPDCFVGRGQQLARCRLRLQGGREPVALAITGEAGIGKSAFLRRLVLEAQLDGYTTVFVRCYPEAPMSFATVRAIVERVIPPGPTGRSLRSRYRRCLSPLEKRASSGTSRTKSDFVGRPALLRELIGLLLDATENSPTLLLVDEVHLADPLTVELLAALVREIGFSARRESAATKSPPSLAVSFPSESSFRSALRPLLESLRAPGEPYLLLELPRLDRDAAEQWLAVTLNAQPEARERILAFSSERGNPFEIQEAIRLGPSGVGIPVAAGSGLQSMHREYLQALDEEQRRAVDLLAVLGRPASLDVLADLLASTSAKTGAHLASLLHDGTLNEENGLWFFQHNSFRGWLLRTLSTEKKKALHRRIAEVLEAKQGESLDEVARHWLDSDAPERGVEAALAAARNHVHSGEPKRALRFYPAVLDLLPPRQASLRRAVADETADAFSRTGDYSRAIEILESLLDSSADDREASGFHGRIGIYHHRAGNVPKAVFHLEQGLARLGRHRGTEVLRQRLRLQSELAEIASSQGRFERAEAICQEALHELEESQDARQDSEIRREEIVLLETRAHLRLRRFQYGEARKYFEKSLKLSEELDAAPERGLILNKLGILHSQENRFPQAIDCYRKAERLSVRLGDTQNLAAIYCNLAVLHAKTGDLDAAEDAIRLATQNEAQCDSRRARFLRLHSAGMVDHLSGRYASAIESLQRAIDLGEVLKDQQTVAIDLVYLGECRIFRAEGKAAQTALEQALSLGAALPSPLAGMAKTRIGLLAALRGDLREAKQAWSDYEERPTREIGYLDAGNRLLLGWARRLCGSLDEAEEDLEYARSFFSRKKVLPGEIHATLELVQCDLDRGHAARAKKRLHFLGSRFTCGRGVLRNPMLSARFLACQTRLLLEKKTPDYQEAASRLVEAESYLIGRHLQELESQVRQLKRKLHVASLKGNAPRMIPEKISGYSTDELDLLGFLKNSATDLIRRFEEEVGTERAESLRRHLRDFEGYFDEVRRRLEARSPAVGELVRSDALIGGSVAMRRVVSLIRRIAPSDVPVLVRGETGTGKELVARAIHGESRRSAQPFVSLNCAALPEELLEAELFGHIEGAFSGAEQARSGLLRSAQGGSFFFDEVGDLPLTLQAKLLHLLDRSTVRPLGGTEEIPIDVRFIFSAKRDLGELSREGGFRSDLFFRLGSFEILVPPLRERAEDLPDLVNHFRSLMEGEREPPPFDEEVLRLLAGYPWPGNVRELQNTVFRLALTGADRVSAADLQRTLGKAPVGRLFSTALLRSRSLTALTTQLEREYLVQLHSDCGGDLKAMAKHLGIKLRALYERFRRLDLRPQELMKQGRASLT